MTNARHQKRKRAASQLAPQGVGGGDDEFQDDVTNISPRDITSCTFENRVGLKRLKVSGEFRGNDSVKDGHEKRNGESAKEGLKVVEVEHNILSRSPEIGLEGNDPTGVGKDENNIYLSYGVESAKRDLEVGEGREEMIPYGVSRMEQGGPQLGGRAKSREGEMIGTVKAGEEAISKKRKAVEISHEASMGGGSGYARHPNRGTQGGVGIRKALEAGQREETGTSSSSSFSKRSSRVRRTSTIYLQQTRAHRRAVAKARTERLRREKEEEEARERVRMMEGMEAEEREKAMERLENERREREAARRKDLKRVKNRESVEKSRVRELVLEKQVGSEWDALRRENECMMNVLEWFKRDLVVKNVRKEVNAVIRKRKRRKS